MERGFCDDPNFKFVKSKEIDGEWEDADDDEDEENSNVDAEENVDGSADCAKMDEDNRE